MSSLPQEFNRDESEDHDLPSNESTEVPLRFDPRDRAVSQISKPKKNGSGFALPVSLLSLLLSVMVFSLAVDHPVQRIVAMFGGKKVDQTSEAAELQLQIETFRMSISEASRATDQAKTELRSVVQSLDGLRAQFTDIETRQTSLENSVAKINSKIEALNARPVPKPIAVKPKEPVKPPVLVNVVSIRNQGGVVWASLREGLNTSNLLTVGDEWRGFKVVGIDPASRAVQVASNGTVLTVRL
ncbi:hypothetical protein GCM10011613_24870 [Cellvibrio zantedeschiae]|uniref:Type IV pilus biogenesis protein PilP n=1 Tax=Cellvibrio zantedeschiae TaxID=1237077 RepID=A0ABQ3B478_9GAMM|nr:hypothetical protein [Cellvibrio zantedeschiae]GGY79104.1 hypothetical protein GCM10011613_24870 [Cellvibrio zantedeschiae]